MTLYILYGLAQGARSSASTCRRTWSQRGWQYLARHFRERVPRSCMAEDNCGWEFADVPQLRRLLATRTRRWMGDALTPDGAQGASCDFSFTHWKEHSPYLKGQLALTLKRAGRADGRDARLGQRHGLGEDRPRTSARTGRPRTARGSGTTTRSRRRPSRCARSMELDPARLAPPRPRPVALPQQEAEPVEVDARDGRGHLLARLVPARRRARSAAREEVTVDGRRARRRPSSSSRTATRASATRSSCRARRSTRSATPRSRSRRAGKGLAFASATWHFSTEKLPAEDRGDFFSVSRRYFKREATAVGLRRSSRWPRARRSRAGDEIEVQISLRTKHAAEYVHLRDPRAGRRRAGERPVALQVGPRDRLVRGDARLGTNFFFERLPGGRVHVQVPRPREHGRHVQGRPGDGAVDVRAGVQRLLGGATLTVR